MREPIAPTLPIRTDRLLLRLLTDADRKRLHEYRSQPEVCRFLPFRPMDLPEIDRRLAGMWRLTRLTEPGQGLTLGVELVDTGELVGDVILFFTGREEQAGELGWVLNPRFAGHGYATEGARALLEMCFDEFGMHRVAARIDPRNDASARVAERLGMQREAHFRRNEWIKGVWEDTVVYAILDSDPRPSAPEKFRRSVSPVAPLPNPS